MTYGNESIRSLSDKEAVRLRPANILGSDDINGCFHCLIEIADNAIDEAKGGYGDKIIITKHKDNYYSVEDFGRGVPMDWNSIENKYNYELIFQTLYAGGKYTKNDDDAYAFAKGLNGLGASATAFSSKHMLVRSYRDGYKYEIEIVEGEVVGGLKKEKYNYDSTGTFVKWLPDLSVFTETDIPFEWIKKYAEEQAIVNKGITVEVCNEETNEKHTYYYENGIVDYIHKLNQGKNFTDVVYWETEAIGRDREDKKDYRSKYQIAFCFNNEVNVMESYHNSSFLKHGGSPHEAIKNGFTYAIDQLIKKKGEYKKGEKKIAFDDIKDSLIIITNTYSTETSYENQTKFAITNKFIREFMTEYIKQQLEIYFIENPMEADKIVKQVLVNKRSREKAEQARLDIKKKLQINTGNSLRNKIEDLKDCDMKTTTLDERELWVCEGLSAASTITDARDNRTMGIYALRGRFISSLKNSIEDVLNNKPAMGLIQALGCGIEIPKNELKKFKNIETFDLNNLRYGKIIIACDSDAFGHGITLSLITFFYKFMPTLLKQNRIYISISPRYEIKCADETLFAYNEKQKEEIVSKLERKHKKFTVGIVKGLGELDKEVYWDYVMNPETRILKQLIYDEQYENQINYYFNTLMGEDIDERKKYVKQNIINLDLTFID
jgi:DNA gyrase subunit B